MQDKYAGDIGDYIKFAILRAAAPGHWVGIAWWRYLDEMHNGNGRHIGYLEVPARWRSIDAPLFDKLDRHVATGRRSIAGLQALDLVPAARYHSELLPAARTPVLQRVARAAWFDGAMRDLADCTLIFADPDNGLEPMGYSAGSVRAGKSIALSEIATMLGGDRSAIVYHHQTRRAGGHMAELAHWAARLRDVGAMRVDVIRAAAFSARAFFVLNADEAMRIRLGDAVARWDHPKITWHPGL